MKGSSEAWSGPGGVIKYLHCSGGVVDTFTPVSAPLVFRRSCQPCFSGIGLLALSDILVRMRCVNDGDEVL